MSQEGRAREARRQRKVSKAAKFGVALVSVLAIASWGYLIAGS